MSCRPIWSLCQGLGCTVRSPALSLPPAPAQRVALAPPRGALTVPPPRGVRTTPAPRSLPPPSSDDTSPIGLAVSSDGSITLPVLFAHGSATLSGAAQQRVAQAAAILIRARIARAMVHGYASSVGSEAANDRLSARRATAVATALRAAGWTGHATITPHGERDVIRNASGVEDAAASRRAVITPIEGGTTIA